jgi:hypothetical protein
LEQFEPRSGQIELVINLGSAIWTELPGAFFDSGAAVCAVITDFTDFDWLGRYWFNE